MKKVGVCPRERGEKVGRALERRRMGEANREGMVLVEKKTIRATKARYLKDRPKQTDAAHCTGNITSKCLQLHSVMGNHRIPLWL